MFIPDALDVSVREKVESLAGQMLSDEWLFARSPHRPASRADHPGRGSGPSAVYKAPGGLIRVTQRSTRAASSPPTSQAISSSTPGTN
jgi:hypothetical protein